MVACSSLSPVCETMALVGSMGMWHSMQRDFADGPMALAVLQACQAWQVRQRLEKLAATCSGSCVLWQVEQVMVAED